MYFIELSSDKNPSRAELSIGSLSIRAEPSQAQLGKKIELGSSWARTAILCFGPKSLVTLTIPILAICDHNSLNSHTKHIITGCQKKMNDSEMIHWGAYRDCSLLTMILGTLKQDTRDGMCTKGTIFVSLQCTLKLLQDPQKSLQINFNLS